MNKTTTKKRDTLSSCIEQTASTPFRADGQRGRERVLQQERGYLCINYSVKIEKNKCRFFSLVVYSIVCSNLFHCFCCSIWLSYVRSYCCCHCHCLYLYMWFLHEIMIKNRFSTECKTDDDFKRWMREGGEGLEIRWDEVEWFSSICAYHLVALYGKANNPNAHHSNLFNRCVLSVSQEPMKQCI